jgi:uncharacterized membrane protein
MEKRVLGIILSIVGIIGLIIAAISIISGTGSNRGIKEILVFSILGAIFFFAGIGLVRNTSDKPT